MARGCGTLMAKFGVPSAYRNTAIHLYDQYLLGMKWRDSFFVDLALPFGLWSALLTLTKAAEMVECMSVNNHGVDFLRHYLDDFFTLGPPASSVCSGNMHFCIQLYAELGLPLNPDKLEGPLTCLTILGIKLYLVTLQARLPENKQLPIIVLLEAWSSKQVCKQKELESLIGHLYHACDKIALQGWTFLCRMIDILCAFCQDDHPIQCNQEFWLDLAWWQELLSSWEGISFFLTLNWAPLPHFHVSSDAAGALGYSVIFNGHWFWTESQCPLSIAYKELFKIVVAAHVWGSQ